jgi:hypothetical protein
MTEQSEALTARLTGTLRSSVNGDGGWGYVQGKTSRLEPTCWAALALLDSGVASADRALADSALSRIAAWQVADGLLSDTPGALPNVSFSGLASVVMHRATKDEGHPAPQSPSVAERLVSAIVAMKGTRERQNYTQRQNNRLAGWPWQDGTFSWVEPTSWGLLALKTTAATHKPAAVAARIEEAERVLVDRCCVSGGWNAGNSNALGQELPPYVPTTALGLLALQDRKDLFEVTHSLGWLTRSWTSEVSGIATSLSIVAMGCYGLQVEAIKQALCNVIAKNGTPENITTAAMVLYALTGTRHEYEAFAL